MAVCQVSLRRYKYPNLPFSKAFIYGPSTSNVRIERWWGILTEGQTENWKRYFGALEGKNLFNGEVFEVIALQYLYMDRIREQIQTFVDLHNTHRIRKQTKHDFLGGVPDEMYRYLGEGKIDYADKETLKSQLFKDLKKKVEFFDYQEYLHPETRELCDDILKKAGKWFLRPY